MSLIGDFGYLVVIGLVAASFVTSFISGIFGVGGGVLLISLLASVLPPLALIPVHGVVQLASNAGRTLLMTRHFHKAIFVPFLVGSLFGILLGGVIAVNLPPGLVLTGVGLFILWSVLGSVTTLKVRSSVIAGFISSVLTMFFGATGPLVAGWLKSLGFDRLTHVSTQSLCLTLQHLLKTLAFVVLGFDFWPWLPLIGLMIVAGFLGTWVGGKVLQRTGEARFRRVLNLVLILLALQLIWRGLWSLDLGSLFS